MSLRYNNINSTNQFYQVPFSLFYSDVCLGDEYLLCFGQTEFYYDFISDNQIKKMLSNNIDVDIDRGWERGKFKFANYDIEYHTMRIAKLVSEIELGKKIKPVMLYFDELSYKFAPNYIEDGNHRIRAFKYLGYDYFPAYIFGSHAKYLIDYLRLKF